MKKHLKKPGTRKPRPPKPKSRLKPIEEVARSAGIKKKYLELFGPYKAKVSLDAIRPSVKKKGKYIVITSVTPTPFGEGKTLTAVGLAAAFRNLRKKAIPCVLQPSMADIFSASGKGTGAGFSAILPAEDANLHLTGDAHAVEAATNICASYLDNSLFIGNPLNVDPGSIAWERAVGSADRCLRIVNTGLGTKNDGIPRKTGFSVTAASELMAILALSQDLKDLRARVGRIILGFTKKGKPVTCEGIQAAGAVTALLKDALKPNLLQSTEHAACLMHTVPAGNVSVEAGSVVADRMALGLCDYAIVEVGFGADAGAEKFFDIKCRTSGLKPDACVIVCSVRALKMHSGDFEITSDKLPREILRESVSAVERGLSNLEKQIENVRTFGVPVVVCINRFPEDTEKEVQAIRRRAQGFGAVSAAVSTAWADGGRGATELARAIVTACKIKPAFRFLYPLDMPLKEKIRRIARTIYGAKDVMFSEETNKKALLFRKLKLDNLPVCVAKTPLSLSHNPKRKGRPHGFKFPVDDILLWQGAGCIVALSSNAETMPALPKVPRGTRIDVDEEGNITGLV